MPTIRTWVIATAAAFLVLPLTDAWARDCRRDPCAPAAEAKTANAAAPRTATVVQKRKARAAKSTQRVQAAANQRRPAREPAPAPEAREPAPVSGAPEPAADLGAREPTVPTTSLTIRTIDWAVMLPQPLAHTVPEALARRHDQPAFAAAGGAVTLPGGDSADDNHASAETAPTDAANTADDADSVPPFVDARHGDEIDLAAATQPAPSSWLRYVLATLGALAAAASTLRYLFV